MKHPLPANENSQNVIVLMSIHSVPAKGAANEGGLIEDEPLYMIYHPCSSLKGQPPTVF